MTAESTPQKSSKTGLYVGAVVIVIIIIVVGVLAYQLSQPPSTNPSASPSSSGSPSPSSSGSTKSISIYAGQVSSSVYGFGTSSSSITSPGPDLTFSVGDVVTVTFYNTSPNVPHNLAFVTAKTDGNTNLAFANAQVASAGNPVAGGSSASATFTVTQAGNFYYICQVDAHVTLGMWGNVIVNP